MRYELEAYIREVMRYIHASPRQRERIERDLRAHLAEAAAAGESLETARRRLGSPQQVAEAFMASVTLRYAGFWKRLAAFLVDLVLLIAISPPLVGLWFLLANAVPQAPQGVDYVVGGFLIFMLAGFGLLAAGVFILYFPILEGRFGQTPGKRLFGLWVLKENGLPIGFKEAFLRRLPFYFDFLPIDALFIPFTAKRQRAFDIIARTVVVREEA